jgi:hypothetical protein
VDAGAWIALGALAFTVAAWLLERRARRQGDELERSLREQEAARRDEELELLRQRSATEQRRVMAEEQSRRRRLRADLSATPGPVNGGTNGGQIDLHLFAVTCAGPSPARNVQFAAVDSEGTVVAARRELPVPLMMAGDEREIAVPIPMALSRAGGLRLRGQWQDENGPRLEVLCEIKRHG